MFGEEEDEGNRILSLLLLELRECSELEPFLFGIPPRSSRVQMAKYFRKHFVIWRNGKTET